MASYGRIRNPLQRPEAVLQRAEEFISVNKKKDALAALHEIIKDRRHKQWSSIHEQIMLKHLELCVELKEAGTAKDALYQYKTLTQQVAVGSLETVMKHLIKLAEQRAESAQKESIEKIEEIDDLDSGDAPESLLLSVVSGAVPQDRMDRAVLSPWLRFLWDSYRNCLDLLRNNSLVENLYHSIARQSFAFCIKYQRRNEFRKLCDLLRLHLSQLQKNLSAAHGNANQRINIADSLSIMQETRLIQLDTAIQMELWQEAYKSTEDLHNLMQLSKEKEKRSIKPQSYVNYFDKLSLIFWKGGNRLFHSAALLQKYNIYKDMKKSFTGEEASEQATRVLLATLSIAEDYDTSSILTKHLDMEDMHLGNVRVLSALLRLPIAPTRKGILKEIARLNIPEISQGPVGRLYRLMEVDFAPLEVAKLIETELDAINKVGREEFSQYIEPIRAVVATKILKALTNIYEALPIERMSSIIPFYSRSELEHFLVHITKQRFLKAQVDHREGCIRFGPIDATLAGDVETEYGETNAYKGGYESIRIHLMRLYELLGNSAYELDKNDHKTKALERFTRLRGIYEYHKEADYERMILRKKIIEQHKENNENIRQEKIQQAQLEAAKREEQRRNEEMKKLKEDSEERIRIRREEEKKEIERKIRMERYSQNPIYSQIVKEKGEEALKDMDPELVLREQRERMDAERREQAIKMLQQERKFDYFVRAFNIEERAIVKQMSEEARAKAPERFAQCEARRIQKAKEDREKALATYERLEKAKTDAITFIRGVVESHREDLDKKLAEYQKIVAKLREKKLQERKIYREKERKKQWELEKKAEKERQEAELRTKQEMEREEKAAAINASRERRDRFDRPERERRPEPESKADNESDWRSSNNASRPRPIPSTRTPAKPVAASGPVPNGEQQPSVADAASDWRRDRPVGTTTPKPQVSTPAPKPAPPPTEADTSSSWRRSEPQKPAASLPTPASAGGTPGKPGKYQPPRRTQVPQGSTASPAQSNAPRKVIQRNRQQQGKADEGNWR